MPRAIIFHVCLENGLAGTGARVEGRLGSCAESWTRGRPPQPPFGSGTSEGVKCAGLGSSFAGFALRSLPFETALWHLRGYLELAPQMNQARSVVVCARAWVGAARSSQLTLAPEWRRSHPGLPQCADSNDNGRSLSICDYRGLKALNPSVFGPVS